MALTFTNRAAGEMRSRLAELGVAGVSVRTFHSAALRQLRYFWPRISSGQPPQLVGAKLRLITEAAARSGTTPDATMLRDVATDIEWAKGHGIDSAQVLDDPRTAGRAWSIDPATFAGIFHAYDELKAERHVMDFEDLLLITVGALQSRPDILDNVRSAYRWFTIDEFQDVSPLQHELLTVWRGDRDEVCAVGDVSQTIYSFAGASPDFLIDFAREFSDATVVRLANCYRCSPQIVLAANALVVGQEASEHAVRLRSMCADGPEPIVSVASDEVAEAEGTARRVRELIAEGVPPGQIAILFRMNAQSAVLEEALAGAGIPVSMRGTERFFDRPEVREAITRLRGSAFGEEAVGTLGDRTRGVLSSMGWTPQPPMSAGAVRDRWESLAAMVTLAELMDRDDAHQSLSALVVELERRAEAQHAPTTDAVTLSSLHSAKGLEWDAVFIVGCSEGLIPLNAADSAAAVQEERRLLYVGMTRARRRLQLSWARARQPGGPRDRRASRFLQDVDVSTDGTADAAVGNSTQTSWQGVLVSGSGRRRTERAARSPGRCRVCDKALVTGPERTLGRCRTCPGRDDPQVRARLADWRAGEAKRRSAPEFVVMTDATLEAIAEVQPSTLPELGDIPGMDEHKLATYGALVLDLISGSDL